ncbi:MAG: [acyl-carrier-protein] S-malonyltransferase, partial [Dehalococcoidia bacterium]|nr:[acyl-carrier-protein] S-malonyltransferase [Dehalococcoidia bacterium]
IYSLPFQDASIPIVGNTSAKPLTKATDIKEELIHQLCHCIEWQSSIEFMINNGTTNFIEIGPGAVLTGLNKRISREVSITNVGCFPA